MTPSTRSTGATVRISSHRPFGLQGGGCRDGGVPRARGPVPVSAARVQPLYDASLAAVPDGPGQVPGTTGQGFDIDARADGYGNINAQLSFLCNNDYHVTNPNVSIDATSVTASFSVDAPGSCG